MEELPLNRFLSLASVHREPKKKEEERHYYYYFCETIKSNEEGICHQLVPTSSPNETLGLFNNTESTLLCGVDIITPPRQSIGVHLVSEIQCRGIQIVAIDLSHIQQNVEYAKRNLVGHG